MTLIEYLEQNELTPRQFAEKIGVSGQAVRRYICRERFPRPAIALRIVDETGGAVGFQDLYHPSAGEAA